MLPPRSTIDKSLLSNVKIPSGNPSNDFPSDVIKHIRNNAIPQQTLKLIKVCKYFLYKKIPLNYVVNIDGFSNHGLQKWNFYQKEDNRLDEFQNVSSNDVPNNLCIDGEMDLRYHSDLFTELIPKIFVCDLKSLAFCYLTNVAYDHYKILTSSGNLEKLDFIESTIIYNNGEIVSYESLLDHVPVLQKLKLTEIPSIPFSEKFAEKIVDLNLKYFRLQNIKHSFDFEAFLESLKKTLKLEIELHFFNPSDCFDKINTFIDKLAAAAASLDSSPPWFTNVYPRCMDGERQEALVQLRQDFLERNRN